MKEYLTIISFCASFVSFFGALAQNPGLAHSPAILTFTEEGCRFAKGLGLNVKQDNNECTGVVRFDSYRLGGGGSIRLDDDRVVMISASSLLAWQPAAGHDIPDTPAQENALLRYWIFMLLALLFTVASFKLAFGKNKRSARKDVAP